MSIPFDPGPPPIAQMMGMPKGKKTRRGKGGRGGKMQSDPASHMDAASKALAAGDHLTAKKHAFALVRSLHAKHPPAIGKMPKANPFPGGIQSTGIDAVPPAMSVGTGSDFPARASRLAKALKSQKGGMGGMN